jgi:predicted nucleic acid-binding protein
MTFSNCLSRQDSVLVLDASVVINLLASRQSDPILRALGVPVLVTDNVVQEIERGAAAGRPEFSLLTKAINEQLLRVEKLEGAALAVFFELVSGDAASSLGDGEAATLALADGNKFVAAIDEKKATRIAAERFPSLRLVTTIDLLADVRVHAALDQEKLVDATFDALRFARMQVRDHQFDWVSQLLGAEKVAACPSLRRYVRRNTGAA